jgi:hypothetical protein
MSEESNSNQLYQVIFAGAPAEGFNLALVKENIRQRFGLPPARLELLFSGRPVSIKTNLSWDQAWLFQQRMKTLGAKCQIVPLKAVPESQSATPKPGLPCPKCRQPTKGDTCSHCGFDLGAYRATMMAKGFVETPDGFIHERRRGDRRSGLDRRNGIRYEEGRRSGLDRRSSESIWDRV